MAQLHPELPTDHCAAYTSHGVLSSLQIGTRITGQPGVGTFIRLTLADAALAAHGPLREQLYRWLSAARQAGLDEESIEALFDATLRDGAAPLAS